MKKFILFGFTIMLLFACKEQEQRYFAESAETNTLKAGIAAYESGDWDTWKSHFADTAKIYVNSNKSISLNTRVKSLQDGIQNFSSYGFDKEDEYMEMVLDKEKETWVYYWAQWNGELSANKNKISVPIHLALQFVDGKIVEEHVYFDATIMNKEMSALANMTDMEKMIAENVNNIAQSWIKNDLDSFNNQSTKNVGRSVNGVRVVKDQKEYNELIQLNHNMLSDINITINDMFIKENKSYFKWNFSGKNTKDLPNAPATNKPVSINGYSIWSFNDEGKATYEDVYFDQNDVNVQLGYTITPPK